MKVKLAENYRSTYTLEELEQAKAVIKAEKENDDETAKGWAEYAANEALKNTGDYIRKVIEAEAETALNSRIWNAYDDETGRMDVWIRATVKTWKGFIEIGAYLSDIWQTGAAEYKHHMYIEKYERV